MKVLLMMANSGKWRLLNVHTVDTYGQLAAIMHCAVEQIEMSYLDDEHVVLQCMAEPHKQNAAFLCREWDFCRLGGDAVICRVDGRDIDPRYEPPVRAFNTFDVYERTDLCQRARNLDAARRRRTPLPSLFVPGRPPRRRPPTIFHSSVFALPPEEVLFGAEADEEPLSSSEDCEKSAQHELDI